jgi:UDP-N-acetylmuramate dehydrogenase
MVTIRKFIEKINTKTKFTGLIRYDEPLSKHATFKVGGPAAAWVQPDADTFIAYAAALRYCAQNDGVALFILGGGANVVFSDAGFPGVVLDTGGWSGAEWGQTPVGTDTVVFRAGTSVDDAVEETARNGFSGLEFLAGMPGTIGGAVFMNARCYEKSISDCLLATSILDEAQEKVSVTFRAADFGYKKSPFQNRRVLILAAQFAVRKRDSVLTREEIDAHRTDREHKGHYRFPSAGSVFKNDHAFGKPTGKIIDELGLRGFTHGGAQIAPFHGNIIINTGNATAADIRFLVDAMREKVQGSFGLDLEPEIIFVD